MNVNRRDAVKMMALGTAALFTPSWTRANGIGTDVLDQIYPFQLPELPYAYDALAACIDPETMNIHHTKHHAAYVNNLNKALEAHADLQGKSLRDLLAGLDNLPESIRTVVRNNGGGHANHDLFWKILSPAGGVTPEGKLAGLIDASFGSLNECKEQLRKASMSVFGSGWAWLVLDGETLSVSSTPNQDTPVMTGQTPVVGIDVWEHAYYLRYQNRRADYVASVLDHIDWKIAGDLIS
jgi:Fe-Mn family superoxide dismutase